MKVEMMDNRWREWKYHLHIVQATKGTHTEIYGRMFCVKNFLNVFTTNRNNDIPNYNSFLIIRVCIQGKIFMFKTIETAILYV